MYIDKEIIVGIRTLNAETWTYMHNRCFLGFLFYLDMERYWAHLFLKKITTKNQTVNKKVKKKNYLMLE